MKLFTIYKFNEIEGTKGRSIKMSLPETILEKTLQCLKVKSEMEDEVEEMLESFKQASESNRESSYTHPVNNISWKKEKISFKWDQVLSNRPRNNWKQARNRLEKIWQDSSGSDSSDSR